MPLRAKKLRQEVKHWKAEHSANSERNNGRSLLTSKGALGRKEPATEISARLTGETNPKPNTSTK